MQSVSYSQGASASDWADNKDAIIELWLTRAENMDHLVNILRQEYNFRTTKNICQKHFKAWDIKTYRTSGDPPRRKRRATQVLTEDGSTSELRKVPQGILARAKLIPFKPSAPTLDTQTKFDLLQHSINNLKFEYINPCEFYFTRTGVKVRARDQEQLSYAHQGWPHTWLDLAKLYNTFEDDCKRLHREGRIEEIPAHQEKSTRVIHNSLEVFVNALNGRMPNKQIYSDKFRTFFFRIMLTQLWQVCFRILSYDSTRPIYGASCLLDFLFAFRRIAHELFESSHPLPSMLCALCLMKPEELRWVIHSAASSAVEGMVGKELSGSVMHLWEGAQASTFA